MGAAPSASRRPQAEAVDALPKLHQAVRDGHVENMTRCISGGDQINSRDRIGRTPLMMAALAKGDAEPSVDSTTALANASGIEVAEATDCNGATVVHHLATSKAACRVAAMRALFAALQAPPVPTAEGGAQPVAEGEEEGASATAGNGSAGGNDSAATGRLEDPRLLALLNAQDWDGHTALHAAAHRGDEAMVAALLELGADRSLVSRDQKVPSELAFNAGHADVGLALTVSD